MRRPPDRHAKRRPVRGGAAQKFDAAAKRHQRQGYDGTPQLPRVLDLRADIHGRAIAYACDIDRRHFDENPGTTRYQRAPIDHEFCAPGIAECHELAQVVTVVVTQLAPGVRTRQPLLLQAAS